jgi:O-antigen ligase
MVFSKHVKVLLLTVGSMILNGAMLLVPPELLLIGLGGSIFGVLMLLLALWYPAYVFGAWFLIVPFFANQPPELQIALDLGIANMSPERLLFILVIMVFFVNICLKKIRVLPISHIEKTIVVFCIIVLISLSMHDHFERDSLGVVATRFLFPMLAFFLAKNLFRSQYEVALLMWLLFGLGAYLGLTAFFEFFRVEAFIFPRHIANPNIGIHADRARGPFLQAATNGTAIGMLFFTTIYLYTRVRSSPLRVLIISVAGMMLLGVFFSLTRGAWLGTTIGLLLVAVVYRPLRRLLVLAVVIGAVSLPVLLPVLKDLQPQGVVGERTADIDNVYYRINTWLTGLEMFREHPIFGVGFRRYSELNERYQSDAVVSESGLILSGGDAAHNTYIEVAAELGLVGLIPYSAILVWSFTISIALYRSLPAAANGARNFIVVFWGVASTYLISSFFYTQNSLFLTSLFLTLAGIIDRWSALLAMKSRARVEDVRSLKPSVRPIPLRLRPATRPRSY